MWPYVLAFGGVIFVAMAGGLLTEIGPWYYALRQPAWKPPDWAFGPAWTVIFGLIAYGSVMAWKAAPDSFDKTLLIAALLANGLLNIAWSFFFFSLRRPDWALVEIVFLWVSVALLIVLFSRHSGTASWLLAPYLVWVTFAASVNYGVVRLNGPFGMT